MRKAYVIRHVPFEDLGSLARTLQAHGYDLDYIDAGRDLLPAQAIKNAELLIVLGGPISANDQQLYPFLTEELNIIARRIEQQSATLGLCLGAQLIARASGARVYRADEEEIGWSAIDLTAAGDNSCLKHLHGVKVLHWHGETFDLPPGAEHLAGTRTCKHQAFQLGEHTLALQFHPEVTASGLESWYIGHTLELARAGIDINRLRQESRDYSPVLESASDVCFNDWLQQIKAHA